MYSIPLRSLIEFTSPDRILFGSDWPYAPLSVGMLMTRQFDAFLDTEEGHVLKNVVRKNAERLFGDKI